MMLKPRRHRRLPSLSRLLAVGVAVIAVVVVVTLVVFAAVAVGVGAAVPAAVAGALAVATVIAVAVRSLRAAVDSAAVAVVLVLLAAIIRAANEICSAALKAEQRAFALAGAHLAGEQQALAGISGTWSIRPRVGLPVGGRDQPW